MIRHAFSLACALAVAVPAPARAQAITGVAEWTAANGSSASDGVPFVNRSFWQRYTLGFKSVLLDPRFVEYSATTTFRTNSLTFGGADDRQHGKSNDFGYTLDASLFPSRPFPLVIQASRTTIQESGDYPLSGGIRGSLVVPPGEASPNFETRNESLAISWRLASPSLPQVELDFRSSNSVASSGSMLAEQHDVNVHARIAKDTRRTRQALVYQRTETDNLTTQAFNLRLTDLSYDGSATLSQRNRLTLRIGRRKTFSLFDIPAPIVDPGTGAYPVPSRGTVDAFYVISGVAYEPHHRIALDLTASLDRQDSRDVETGAKLLSTSARYEPARGLSLFAIGSYGNRDQVIGNVATDAMTQNVQAGASYRIGGHGLNANVAYTRGLGTNSTPGGRVGDINSWTGQAGLSFSVRGLTVGGGYERAQSEDEIFAFGNYDNRRQFVTVQTQIRRLTVTGAWDRALLVRGRDVTFSEALQDTFTASISSRVAREGRLTLSAGGFSSSGSFGRDETLFCGGSFEAQILRRLMLTMSVRYDDLQTSGTGLAQNSLGGLAKLDYHVRLFVFALEYQHHEQSLRYAYQPDLHTFNGRQLLLRVSRTFGFHF